MPLDRKEMKRPDAVLKSLQEGFEWSQLHLNTLLIIAIAVFLAAVCWVGFHSYHAKKEEKATLVVNTAQQKFNQKFEELKKSKKENIIEGLSSELKELHEASDTFPKTQATLLSNLKLGDFYLEQKRFSEAETAYEQVLHSGKHPLYKVLLFHNLGYLFEISGNYSKAIEYFEKITQMQKKRILFWFYGYRPNAFWLSSAYFGMGRCYEKMGKFSEAKEMYGRVENQFAQTLFADKAQGLVSLVSSKGK